MKFEWRRKKNNHELLVDDIKIGTIVGNTISRSFKRTECAGGCCDCYECQKEDLYVVDHVVEFKTYYKGQYLGTYPNITEAKLRVQIFTEEQLG